MLAKRMPQPVESTLPNAVSTTTTTERSNRPPDRRVSMIGPHHRLNICLSSLITTSQFVALFVGLTMCSWIYHRRLSRARRAAASCQRPKAECGGVVSLREFAQFIACLGNSTYAWLIFLYGFGVHQEKFFIFPCRTLMWR